MFFTDFELHYLFSVQRVKYLLGEVGSGEKWNYLNKNGFTAVML